jgi:hypothetical protein
MSTRATKLYGVVNPTGQDDGFHVPVFIDPERSNHPLVQIVNEQNHIEAFEPFFTAINIKVVDFDVTKKVGDPAFWYFELKAGPLYGDIEDIQSQFQRRRIEVEDNPHIALQILTACKMEEQEATIQAVRNSLSKSIGRAGANAWLDTNVISPRIRGWMDKFPRWLDKPPRTGRKSDFRFLTSKVLAVTSDDRTAVLVPEALKSQIGDKGWKDITTQLTSLLKLFEFQFGGFTFLGGGTFQKTAPSDVPLLKREAVSAFAKTNGLSLRQMTKSYFEAPSGGTRVVCTFSSRYEGKGKRKYWFGYHKTWDRWLEGSSEGFLLLGCKDARLCFALPQNFVRAQLPNLRSTGTGKDQYWHLDIVDVGGKKNLLDVPRLREVIALSEFAFAF